MYCLVLSIQICLNLLLPNYPFLCFGTIRFTMIGSCVIFIAKLLKACKSGFVRRFSCIPSCPLDGISHQLMIYQYNVYMPFFMSHDCTNIIFPFSGYTGRSRYKTDPSREFDLNFIPGGCFIQRAPRSPIARPIPAEDPLSLLHPTDNHVSRQAP
jgi:hypothetical protein